MSDDERCECPTCGRKSVERRGPNIPENVNRREVGDVMAEFVCRNQRCKWTGDEDELPYEYEEQPPEDHQSVFKVDVVERRADGGERKAETFGFPDW